MSKDSRRLRLKVRIEGRVQGVWFRAWTQKEALERGLAGYVRNLASGAVEAVFDGPAEAVEEMLAACWRGPSAARVVSVAAEPLDDSEPLSGFVIEGTL